MKNQYAHCPSSWKQGHLALKTLLWCISHSSLTVKLSQSQAEPKASVKFGARVWEVSSETWGVWVIFFLSCTKAAVLRVHTPASWKKQIWRSSPKKQRGGNEHREARLLWCRGLRAALLSSPLPGASPSPPGRGGEPCGWVGLCPGQGEAGIPLPAPRTVCTQKYVTSLGENVQTVLGAGSGISAPAPPPGRGLGLAAGPPSAALHGQCAPEGCVFVLCFFSSPSQNSFSIS